MRNSITGNTSKTNTTQDETNSNNAEKVNARKMKQARLPFKVIDPGTSPVASKIFVSAAAKVKDEVKDIHTLDGRKRKLSNDTDEDCGNNDLKKDDNTSKENVEILAAATKKKKLSTESVNDAICEVLSVLDEDNNDVDAKTKDTTNSSVQQSPSKKELTTPKPAAKDKRKGAGTPKTASTQKEKSSCSGSKLQIKLPLSAGKKKRRKSSLSLEAIKNGEIEKPRQEFSGDEMKDVAVIVNPHKRTKLDDVEAKSTETNCGTAVQKEEIETVVLDSSDSEEVENKQQQKISQPNKTLGAKGDNKTKSFETAEKTKQRKSKRFSKSLTGKSLSNTEAKPVKEECHNQTSIEPTTEPTPLDGSVIEKEEEDVDETVVSDNDNEADDETDNLVGRADSISPNVGENSKSQPLVEIKENRTGNCSKVLTPKQVKLFEQRRKAREEKERKLQEEKLKKQREKEEKELTRKREREEKEEQKRKEREEKEEQKRKEREEKERKRLAEVEAKNEEKRKKNEAKEEELRKKEEERKRKEQEKEEAENKKKKAAQAFTKFFVAKTPGNSHIKNEDDSNTDDGTKILAFRPFQIKGDMQLAPVIRKHFTTEAKNRLDDALACQSKANDEESNETSICNPLPLSELYLAELRSGKILPGRWRRPSVESKDEVILVDDDLERVGQEIVEEIPAYVQEKMRVKFYKFADNRRPPYYGTWRKKSSFIKPRKPFAQDKKFFDYEVDSDDEWEEEEPGESLEDGSDDDKEKESEEDEYQIDNEWIVPHGHLSEEELQNEDEVGLGDDNTREAQKVKLRLLQQEFAQEMKKKTEKIKPRLIGCIWADPNGNQPAECAKILWDTLEKKAMQFDEPLLIEEPEVGPSETHSPSAASNANAAADKLKPIGLSENMIKDLTRLVHGNNHAKNFLINEYIAFVEKTEESVKKGDLRKPLKSVVRDKIDELAEWQAVDAHASSLQEIEQTNSDTTDKKKKKTKRRLCWVVKQEMLDKMDLSSLELQNSWHYTLPPKYVKTDKEAKINRTAASAMSEGNITATENIVKEKDNSTMKQKSPSTPSSANISSNETSRNRSSLNSSITTSTTPTRTPKAKKRGPMLAAGAKGQQTPTQPKNKLISQFLQQKNKNGADPPSPKLRSSTTATSPNIVDDDVVILD